MDRPAGLAWRWLRALLMGGVALGGGVVGHVSADGLLPGPVALVALGVATVAAAGALLGRPASTLRVVLLLVVGQALIHLTLTASAGHRGDPVRAPTPSPTPPLPDLAHAGPRTGSLHDQLYAGQPAVTHVSVPVPLQHIWLDLTGPNALMALAHLAAAAAVGLWMAQGERALWVVLALTLTTARELVDTSIRRLGAALGGPAHTLPAVRRPDRWCRSPHGQAPRLLLLARALSRRGPPELLTA